MSFNTPRAIVTGHSRGLGAAIAAALLARGIAVTGVSRQGHPDLAAQFPALLDEIRLDLADPAAVSDWLRQHGAALSGGDQPVLLINNAGMVAPIGPLGTQDPTQLVRAITLNVTAPLLLANAVMAARPITAETRILHVSSGAGRSPLPGWSVYCATKAALDHHARTVAADQQAGLGRRVRIASLAPGVVDTDMQADLRAAAPEVFPQRNRFQALKQDGGLTTPAVAAEGVVRHLLSPTFGDESVTDLRTL